MHLTFDKDGDGNIIADERYDVISSIGQMVSRQHAVDMIQWIDTDGQYNEQSVDCIYYVPTF